MGQNSGQEGLKIRSLTLRDQDEVIHVLASSFTKNEVMHVCLKIPASAMAERAKVRFPKVATDELSLVCEDVSNSSQPKIVGICLNQPFDVKKVLCQPEADIDSAVGALVMQLQAKFLEARPGLLKDGELTVPVFRIAVVGVQDGYLNRGIALQLLKTSLNIAKDKGYEIVFAEATGVVSQKLFKEKLGFTEVASQVYKDFEYKAEKPFLDITQPQKCLLVEKYIKHFEKRDVPLYQA